MSFNFNSGSMHNLKPQNPLHLSQNKNPCTLDVKKGLFIHAPTQPPSNLQKPDSPNTSLALSQHENECMKLVILPPKTIHIPPTKQEIQYMVSLQRTDEQLLIILNYLNRKQCNIDILPLEIRENLLKNRYSVDPNNNLLLYKESDGSAQFVVPFTPKILKKTQETPYGLLSIDLKTLIMIQSSDVYLNIIKEYLTNIAILASNLYTLLPCKMKRDLLCHKYHIRQNVLYYQKGFNFLIVLPPTNAFYKIHPLIPLLLPHTELNINLNNNEIKQFYDCNICCYVCGETAHIAINCPNKSSSTISPNNSCIDDIDGEKDNFGDKLSDYIDLKVSIANFVSKYNEYSYILICGECDFSFTKSLIYKRGETGINMCVTSWYYYIPQWYNGIVKEIGRKEFSLFVNNLKYCKQSGAKITFGVDAKYLHTTAKKWNKIHSNINEFCLFDVVILTLPRVHDEKWNKIQYNVENELLILQILTSVLYCLKENGEIHMLLLKGQFCNWKIKNILNQLNLEIAFWSELDKNLLNLYFNGYIPRDAYGNAMKIDEAKFYFSCFKIKSIKQANYC